MYVLRRPGLGELLGIAQSRDTSQLHLGADVWEETERWHYVGDPGEVDFAGPWSNWGNGQPDLAFMKDPLGQVIMRGAVVWTGGSFDPIVELPPGYTPKGSFISTTIIIGPTYWRLDPHDPLIPRYWGEAHLRLDASSGDPDSTTLVKGSGHARPDDPGPEDEVVILMNVHYQAEDDFETS